MSHYKPDPNKNVSLTIDGMPVTVPEGTRILEAARKVNVHIPTLCDHPDLCKRALCRLCVVECDGKGKLLAACANDVWEGVNIITNNLRILTIRKTIVEMLLASHPQECLTCIRSTNCELQTLSEYLLIREQTHSRDETGRKAPVTESNVLVRDGAKCVKCGRCIEACQEVQTIRAINSSHRGIHYSVSTPYHQELADGPCVFCGQCAEVCPVGAIYEHEQTADVWAEINKKNNNAVIQFDPDSCNAVNDALGLPQGSVTGGKTVAALRRMGFAKVYNARSVTGRIYAAENRELAKRKDSGGSLPLITGCSAGVFKFVENNYPDLKDRLLNYRNGQETLADITGGSGSPVMSVMAAPCIALKYRSAQSMPVLTIRELARMLALAGINFGSLPESPFDSIPGAEAEEPRQQFKTLTVSGFSGARAALDSVRKGECGASLVRIMSCPRSIRPDCPFSGM